ncbi:hypothetical protein [Kocuria rosea]|uniref:hypothetical protein n=1 Tax=Kocuria rosea TaxID=1275 RepID=UPI00203FF078|nr:hypothetical protein [Kocuria rosea]
MFITKPSFYERTMQDSEEIKAIPALLTAPDGTTENGTAVFTGRKLVMTLTEYGAWKLADQLADAIEKNRSNAA